jgi:hypothetical protein
MAPLTYQQLLAIEVCTRTMSVLSLLGSCFIISTFALFPPFRRPINRLVFYATFGNILANVATLISTSGIPNDPEQLSPLCEFQGVLIQCFLLADSFWVFCMAINVFLVFWYGYNAQRLRYLEKWYLLFAYGLPAIPPIIYVVLDHHSKTRIMGSATVCLTCQIKFASTDFAALVLGRERCRLDAYCFLLWACLVSISCYTTDSTDTTQGCRYCNFYYLHYDRNADPQTASSLAILHETAKEHRRSKVLNLGRRGYAQISCTRKKHSCDYTNSPRCPAAGARFTAGFNGDRRRFSPLILQHQKSFKRQRRYSGFSASSSLVSRLQTIHGPGESTPTH